jgi:hypothetical protein
MSRSHTGRQYEPHIQEGESADALIAGSVDDLERSRSRRSVVVDPRRPRDYDRHGQRRAISSIDAKEQSAIGVFPDVLRAIFARMVVRVDTHPHPVAKPFSSQIPTLTSGRILMIEDPMYAKSARNKPLPPAASPPLRSNRIRRSALKSSPTIRTPLGPTPGAR